MSTITLNFEEKQLVELRKKAQAMDFASVEELLQKIASDLLETKEKEFASAMKYLLAKNKELYQRLA